MQKAVYLRPRHLCCARKFASRVACFCSSVCWEVLTRHAFRFLRFLRLPGVSPAGVLSRCGFAGSTQEEGDVGATGSTPKSMPVAVFASSGNDTSKPTPSSARAMSQRESLVTVASRAAAEESENSNPIPNSFCICQRGSGSTRKLQNIRHNGENTGKEQGMGTVSGIPVEVPV